ncbi:hypothetical protein GGS20DRAFT_588042 [Poronia punctata]|nr:hypothetical protein GGS20DRAFT_588042 [Poronia punctata]
MAGSAMQRITRSQPWSGQTYTVASGDDCGSIAVSQSVSAGTLITLNNVLPDCTNLEIGQVLCLPERCTTYSVKSGDSCFAIAAATGITFTQLLSYNPALSPTCTNLIAGSNICVSVPDGVVYTPTPFPANMVSGCTTFHLAVDGDYCWLIANDAGIDVAQFQDWDPDVGADYAVWLGYYYCIGVRYR